MTSIEWFNLILTVALSVLIVINIAIGIALFMVLRTVRRIVRHTQFAAQHAEALLGPLSRRFSKQLSLFSVAFMTARKLKQYKARA